MSTVVNSVVAGGGQGGGAQGPAGPPGASTFSTLTDRTVADIPGTNGPTATALAAKQATLVSGTNIKTVGGASIIGAGDIPTGGVTTYTALTDATTATLPTTNTPLATALSGKQATLISGTNLKTVGGTSLLGSTDIPVGSATYAGLTDAATATLPTTNTALSTALAGKQATLVSGTSIKTVGGASVLGSGDIAVGNALVANPLSQFAATTSAQLAGVLSDETGTGVAVFSISPALTGTPSAPTAAAGTNTTQLATTAHVFAERSNTATLTAKTLLSPTLTTPVFSGTASGTGTLPSTVTMGASPSQADNSLKIATTAYVDTLGATKLTTNAAAAITGANTLTQASHFNRHLSWTGASTAAQALSGTATAGDYVECSNDSTTAGTALTFTGCTAAAGYELQALPSEAFQAVYTNSGWVSLKLKAQLTLNSQSVAYGFVMSDAGGVVYHPAADTTARTWTIPANGSVAFPIGTVIAIENETGAGALTIPITTDTLVLVGAAGSTGSRTLASGGSATLRKVTATRWRIGGSAELT